MKLFHAGPIMLVLLADSAIAQAPPPIADNSFLVEEAYNQEAGIVQHILLFDHGAADDWVLTFGQEWPVGSERHQLSYALRVVNAGFGAGAGDPEVTYRFGLRRGQVHLAPRVTLGIPLGREEAGRGAGSPTFNFNLPVSLTLHPRLGAHANAGVAFAADDVGDSSEFFLGASLAFVASRWANLLLEGLTVRSPAPGGGRETTYLLNPAVRFAIQAGQVQLVPAIARSLVSGPGDRWLAYFSAEHPF